MTYADNCPAAPANPAFGRRAPRIGFELPVRCAYGQTRSTVMLKDMTRFGARIEGLGKAVVDEAVTLLLPGEPAKMAFVVWTGENVAGLEFGEPLCQRAFDRLVRDFAIHTDVLPDFVPPAPAPVMMPAARAA